MKTGVVFPQTESGTDIGLIREYAQTAEGLGYSHVLIYDHVLGADTTNRPDWSGPYTSESLFHEPFVLFGYLAAVTEKLGLVTGIIISPQRQTVLLAKQAASLDVISNGRVRLGIGVGWNEVEYIGLNENFRNRGKREEEQIDLMRQLWTNEVVDYHGKYHTIPEAGINPLPVQRPIPIWLGGKTEPAYRRAARLSDGWMPQFPADAKGLEIIERVREYTREAGRNSDDVGVEGRLSLGRKSPKEWQAELDGWKNARADYVSINTMAMGNTDMREHIAAITRYAEEIGVQE